MDLIQIFISLVIQGLVSFIITSGISLIQNVLKNYLDKNTMMKFVKYSMFMNVS